MNKIQVEELSRDPADFDGRLPSCGWCSDNQATKRVAGHDIFCNECFDEWLMGRFDQDPPPNYHD